MRKRLARTAGWPEICRGDVLVSNQPLSINSSVIDGGTKKLNLGPARWRKNVRGSAISHFTKFENTSGSSSSDLTFLSRKIFGLAACPLAEGKESYRS